LKKQNSKIKGQKDRAKFRNVVRGFSLVHDPEGSHYKRKTCLAMIPPLCHCELTSPVILRKRSDRRISCRPFPFTEPVLSGMRFFPFLFVTLSVRVRMTRSEGFRVRVTKGMSLRAHFTCHCQPFSPCHCERSVAIPAEISSPLKGKD